LKKVLVKLLGLFGDPAVIRRPHNYPATGKLCPPLPPVVTSLHQKFLCMHISAS